MLRFFNTVVLFLFFCAASAVEAQESDTPTPLQGTETSIMSKTTTPDDVYLTGYVLFERIVLNTPTEEILTRELVESAQSYIIQTSDWIVTLRKKARDEKNPLPIATKGYLHYTEFIMIQLRVRLLRPNN